MEWVLKNGRVIDPAADFDQVIDLRIADGKIAEIGKNLSGEKSLECTGLWVTPGLIDIHVHLREPGYEYKEDIASGTAAAIAGGFTAVCCMANTNPVNDNAAVTAAILQSAREAGAARVYPIGAVTQGLAGEDLAAIGELSAAGCVAFSDDGKPVSSGRLMRLAMQYTHSFGKKIICHAEDMDLVANGLMNEGPTATRLGLRGNTRVAEEAMIARDILLAENYLLPVHFAHVSTAGGVELIRAAKARGVQVTAETAPHYLVATDEMCAAYSGNARVNPPLRTCADNAALIEGLLDSTIDCIASDHAPHHMDEKNCEFELAASGISGLETSFSLCYGATVRAGKATPMQLIRWMSTAPAAVLGLPGGSLAIGSPADIAVMDPAAAWTVDHARFCSRGKNTPFSGWVVDGLVTDVYVGGVHKKSRAE